MTNSTTKACQPSIVSAEFTKHMQECEQCQRVLRYVSGTATAKEYAHPETMLCEQGRKTLAAIFN